MLTKLHRYRFLGNLPRPIEEGIYCGKVNVKHKESGLSEMPRKTAQSISAQTVVS
jgi:hypothetical protein